MSTSDPYWFVFQIDSPVFREHNLLLCLTSLSFIVFFPPGNCSASTGTDTRKLCSWRRSDQTHWTINDQSLEEFKLWIQFNCVSFSEFYLCQQNLTQFLFANAAAVVCHLKMAFLLLERSAVTIKHRQRASYPVPVSLLKLWPKKNHEIKKGLYWLTFLNH